MVLRLGALLLQLGLSWLAADTFGLQVQGEYLGLLFSLELLFLCLTVAKRRWIQAADSRLFACLLVDTLLLAMWLDVTGGATNAFVSLLLLPIALAAVILPHWAAWSLALVSTLAYSAMILTMPSCDMVEHNMDSHFLGMWFNFVISALVLTTSVALLAKRMRQKEAELAYLREHQLRQEQLLALGTASAQMAHQLATPLASLRLLWEEMAEEMPERDSLTEFDGALARCELSLQQLRSATEDIRDKRQQTIKMSELLPDLEHKLSLLMPTIQLHYQFADDLPDRHILSDSSLLPALMALIDNGASASREAGHGACVTLSWQQDAHFVRLTIRDYGAGLDSSRVGVLGYQLIDSAKGLGMALVLSHSSLERLGGRLLLRSLGAEGTIAEVWLPIALTHSAADNLGGEDA
ncbi:ATP-binding protein [Shewanella sp. NIFS-20-20]|uniref:ATP-binding protein n=1 Tax=Shewanella sp. NIFS-20-20 TaxID=2853806 RepID=UPI00210E2BF2|nr:ATP-binding protein [Shewanella sp. NIFS-20-20]